MAEKGVSDTRRKVSDGKVVIRRLSLAARKRLRGLGRQVLDAQTSPLVHP